MPNTEIEGNTNLPQTIGKKDEERAFFVRVFASEQIDLVQLPMTVETSFNNKWGQNSAGGKLGSPLWCKNPQYFLNITKPTHIKIILKKKQRRRERAGLSIGFLVTKANSPTTPPESTIIGQGTGTVTIPSSLMQNGMTYAETLQKVSFKKEKGSDHIPEFELPSLNKKLERKLQILENEWRVETNYASDDAAALYKFFKPTQGPFVIVPSMSLPEKMADFDLKGK